MKMLCLIVLLSLINKLGSQVIPSPAEVSPATVLAIIPEFGGVSDDPIAGLPGAPGYAAYKMRQEIEGRLWAAEPTQKLVDLGATAFPAYRKILNSLAKGVENDRKILLFMTLAFEAMPEHQQTGKEMFFDYWEQLKDRERGDQNFAVKAFCKFATKEDIPRLMMMLSTSSSEVVRRILEVGDRADVELLTKWVEDNRPTARAEQGGKRTEPVSFYFLQHVETALAEYNFPKGRLREDVVTRNNEFRRNGTWWLVGGICLILLVAFIWARQGKIFKNE